jgi:FtsH-binding integral membrane protein
METNQRIKIIIPSIISIIMILFAIPKGLSYDYYVILRWVICGLSIYVAYTSYEWKQIFWVWIFGAVAVLFNPIIPVYLNKEIWIVFDIVVIAIFLLSIFLIKQKKVE